MIIWERKFYRDTVHADIEIKDNFSAQPPPENHRIYKGLWQVCFRRAPPEFLTNNACNDKGKCSDTADDTKLYANLVLENLIS